MDPSWRSFPYLVAVAVGLIAFVVSISTTAWFLSNQITDPSSLTREPVAFRAFQRWIHGPWSERQAFLVVSIDQWVEVEEMVGGDLGRPVMDFSQETLVVMTLGTRPSGGYSPHIAGVVAVDGSLEVIMQEERPGGRAVSLWETSPWQVAIIEGHWSKADFIWAVDIRTVPEPPYAVFLGDTLRFSLRNRGAEAITLQNSAPWSIYRLGPNKLLPVEFHQIDIEDITLIPDQSRTWEWEARTIAHPDLAPVLEGLYRVTVRFEFRGIDMTDSLYFTLYEIPSFQG